MKFEGNAVLENTNFVNTMFNLLGKEMEAIIKANQSMCSTSNWDSVTRNYYNQMFNDVVENYYIFFDKYINVLEYLSCVIENYNTITSSQSAGVFIE